MSEKNKPESGEEELYLVEDEIADLADRAAAKIAKATREFEENVEKPLKRTQTETAGDTAAAQIFLDLAEKTKQGKPFGMKEKTALIREILGSSKSNANIGKLIVETAIPLETAPDANLIKSLATALLEQTEYAEMVENLLAAEGDPETAIGELKAALITFIPKAGEKMWLDKHAKDPKEPPKRSTPTASSKSQPIGTVAIKESIWEKIKRKLAE